MNDHFGEALAAINAATNQQDLNAAYAVHLTRLIRNGATRDDLLHLATAWETRSRHLFNQAMGWEQP